MTSQKRQNRLKVRGETNKKRIKLEGKMGDKFEEMEQNESTYKPRDKKIVNLV